MIRRALCRLGCLALPALCSLGTRASAQATSPLPLAMVDLHVGVGIGEGNAPYEDGPLTTVRLGAAWRVRPRVALELAIQHFGPVARGEKVSLTCPDCGNTSPPAANIDGISAGVLLSTSHSSNATRALWALGAGAYRVPDVPFRSGTLLGTTALGLHVGVESVLLRYKHVALTLGVRVVTLVNLRHGAYTIVPLALGVTAL